MNTLAVVNAYEYTIQDVFEDRIFFKSCDNNILQAAYNAAEHFNSELNGNEYQFWPITLSLYNVSGKRIGIFEIDREFKPHFYITQRR